MGVLKLLVEHRLQAQQGFQFTIQCPNIQNLYNAAMYAMNKDKDQAKKDTILRSSIRDYLDGYLVKSLARFPRLWMLGTSKTSIFGVTKILIKNYNSTKFRNNHNRVLWYVATRMLST